MKRCVVVGAGLSGLSSAVYSSLKGYNVEIIESSPKLGGRTYSYFDSSTGVELDNGQHILMGVYRNTLEFLRIIHAENIPEYQKYLNINFVDRLGKNLKLDARSKFYPLNLLIALFSFNALSFVEKRFALNLLVRIKLGVDKNKSKNLYDWLRDNNQSENLINRLWRIISVSALNTNLEETDPEVFKELIRKIFFTGNKSSTIILPNAPLSELFILPVEKFIRKNNVVVNTSERLHKIVIKNKKVEKIITHKRKIENFDRVILAVPNHSLMNVEGLESVIKPELFKMDTASIITIHFCEKEKRFHHKFLGLINFDAEWIFNNNTHLSVVISSADKFIDKDPTEIFEIVISQLEKAIPTIDKENVKWFKVLKSKKATLKCNTNNELLRKSLNNLSIQNLRFAGDWTNTGFPSTIEGAILSGKNASNS